MSDYEEKLKEFSKGLNFEMPTEDEIEEVYRKYKEHECLIQEIMIYKGVSEDVANEIANRVARYAKEGITYDWTESDINFEPLSNYYWTKYTVVNRIVKILRDEEELEYAKMGVLNPRLAELKKKHPFTYRYYMEINNLVREAYYLYLMNMSRTKLSIDRKDLIQNYQDLITSIKYMLDDERMIWDDDKDTVSFQEYSKQFDNEIGVIIHQPSSNVANYSLFCYDTFYLSAKSVISKSHNKQLLIDTLDSLNTRIEELRDLDIEEYRCHKAELMKLTYVEEMQYNRSGWEYKREYTKKR